jgi:NADP-dependent 3-hydroxy acid dehydrogenase YdfG
LANRVVAITGASAGIGRATAIRLAKDGASLVICARRREPLDDTAAAIVKAGGQALAVVADVTKSPIHASVVFPISTETEFFSVMTRESGFATRAAGPRQDASEVADAIVLFNTIAPGLCDRFVRKWGRKPA